ncbi:MAG: hypothetical protein ACK559_39115, partial [bacterium]
MDADAVRQMLRRRARRHDSAVDVAIYRVSQIARGLGARREQEPTIAPGPGRRYRAPADDVVGQRRARQRGRAADVCPLAVLSRTVGHSARVRPVNARPSADTARRARPRGRSIVERQAKHDALGRVDRERMQRRARAARAHIQHLDLRSRGADAHIVPIRPVGQNEVVHER